MVALSLSSVAFRSGLVAARSGARSVKATCTARVGGLTLGKGSAGVATSASAGNGRLVAYRPAGASVAARVGQRVAASMSTTAKIVGKRVDGLIEPHGGKLVDLMVKNEAEIKAKCNHTFELSDRQACDVELLCNGAFSPLTGFMTQAEYDGTVNDMKLPSGVTFSLPVIMDTWKADVKEGDWVLLTYKGEDLAALQVSDRWIPDRVNEAAKCMGVTTIEHPGVLEMTTERGQFYIGGPVHGFRLPTRDIPCKTPAQVRAELPKDVDVVAFQCRNPIHRAHHALFMTALDAENVGKDEGAIVLVHPTVGPTQADDIPGSVRYETYKVLEKEVNDPKIRWAMLPYSMKMAGPREAIHHILIRKNFGCSHFIIGRDMAGSKSSISGEDFYGAFEAQEFAQKIAPTIGMDTVPSRNLVATIEEGYISAEDAKEKGYEAKKLSGTKFRQMLRGGEDIPEWFAFKSVVEVLRKHV